MPEQVAAARARLDRWLVDGPLQLRGGEHEGAVAGTISATGEIVYVYPEITGYYLQWLAWYSREHRDPALRARAVAAQDWLGRWATQPAPPTRVYLATRERDWRNDAVFTFDVAMALRGLASAVREGLIEPAPATVQALAALLDGLVPNETRLEPCRALGSASLPARWSTLPGPFLAKAAAGILDAAAVLDGIPERVVRAAGAGFEASIAALLQTPHDALHPQLYAYEGAIAGAARPAVASRRDALERAFAALVRVVAGSDGAPELASRPHGVQRVDVLAQLVRAARGLGGAATHGLDVDRALQRLAMEVDAAGAVPFALGTPGPRNVWAAMFASQAFAPGFPRDNEAKLIV